MNKTKIEWCDSTWNPVTGCYHKCPYCYARNMVNRFGERKYGKSADMEKQDVLELYDPIKDENGKRIAYPTGFIPTLHRYRLDEYKDKPARTIFVCSMADLFGEWVPDEWIEEVFAACKKAPQHRYLFLTKNPRRYKQLADVGKLLNESNMWYGSTVTTEDQEFYYDNRLAIWSHTFISIEPIMGNFSDSNGVPPQWIIVGAETGSRKDKVVPKKEWLDGIISSCARKSIPLFMKDSLIPIVGEENMRREFPW